MVTGQGVTDGPAFAFRIGLSSFDSISRFDVSLY